MATTQRITYDANGNVVSTETVEIPPEETHRDSIMAQIEQQIARAETADANWSGLSAAQKDVVLRQTMLTLAKMCRYLLNRFESD